MEFQQNDKWRSKENKSFKVSPELKNQKKRENFEEEKQRKDRKQSGGLDMEEGALIFMC